MERLVVVINSGLLSLKQNISVMTFSVRKRNLMITIIVKTKKKKKGSFLKVINLNSRRS